MSDTSIPPPLGQGAGYGVIVGLGLAFALGMIWVTRAMKKSLNEDNHSTETFMVANRSVGVGLTAAAVISSWLYSTALLGASLLTYEYGLALGVWWGASASTMVCFLALISIEAKRRAPNAHTLLELIKVRYGSFVHILWIIFCLVNNILVFSSMLLGASTAVTALTGMNVIASTYLMPLGVAFYTYFGGLRATFLTDYVHTFFIMIVLVWFTIKVILVEEIGSIGALYDAVVAVDRENPVAGNYQGSHLTMRSDGCLYFGILHVISNFGSVIMDTGFWQKGFSADVAAAVPGYVLGGVASFSVPWTVGTVVGLAAIALERTPIFPTYPRLMTTDEIQNGLVLPYVAQAVTGKVGAGLLVVVIFMASTSIASAQLIATSSIISFDIYGTYINKKPTNKQLIRWSHIGVIITTLVISTLATVFHLTGVNMTWLLYALGNMVNPGVFPTCFALFWKGQTRTAAIVSPIVGMICGFSAWFGTAYAYYGEVSIVSTGGTMPCLFGCVTAFFVPLPVSVIISLIKPSTFDYAVFQNIKKVKPDSVIAVDGQNEDTAEETWFTPERIQYMKRMSRWAAFWSALTITGHVLLWPLPMYGAKMVFSKELFTAWIVVSFIYLWFTLIVSNIYPLFDGGYQQIWTVLRGKQGSKAASALPAESPASDSSDEKSKQPRTSSQAV
ncbi:SSS family solute:Na+ symporter [Xylariales sp. PMI_506]|nr:SSS family solute:Na+ symporter [Xylariales sp. PMI_506]